MENFPGDVAQAEMLTGGDPNILESKELDSKKRSSNYWADIFPTSKSPAKNKSEKIPYSNLQELLTNRAGFAGASSTMSDEIPISPRADNSCSVRTLMPSSLSPEKTEDMHKYRCVNCDFATNRINLIIHHNKYSHVGMKPAASPGN